MTVTTLKNNLINEGTTVDITIPLLDQSGAAITESTLDELFLTYYDRDTLQIINLRDGQNILDANDVDVDVNGVATWSMQITDTVIINTAKNIEDHVALVEWTWNTDKKGKEEFILTIKNINKRP